MCLEPPGLIRLAVDPITLETAVPQCAPSATGYPSLMGPGVPKERVEAIRSADLESLKDPEFIDAIQRQGLDLDPIGAGELAEVVRGIYALPEAAVEVPAICCPRYNVHQ